MSEAIDTTTELTPGLYPGIGFDEYLGWDAASNSRLGDLKRSAAYCRYRIDHSDGDTPSKLLGSAVHCALLEPDDFEARWAKKPEGDGRTKAVKEAVAESQLGGRQVVPNLPNCNGWEMCTTILDRAREHRKLRALLDQADGFEVSALGEVPRLDAGPALCKVRPDILAPHIGMLGDLKTTRDASPRGFAKSVYDYGYHRAAAFYLDTVTRAGAPVENFVLIAVENTAPHEIALYELDGDALELGRREYVHWLDRYEMHRSTDTWPGYSQDVGSLSLPPWAESRTEEELSA